MSDMQQDARRWALKEVYGMTTIPPNQDYETLIKAVLICAKGDGVLAPEERNWLVGRAAAYRMSGYELAKTYSADEDLLEVLSEAPTMNASGRRLVIYLAFQACGADGDLHPEERAQINKMASYLGVSEDVVNQIEQFCIEEAEMRKKRVSLMFPQGIPY